MSTNATTDGVSAVFGQRMQQAFIEGADLEKLLLDSTTVRAPACAAGAKKGGQSNPRSRSGGFNTKIHAVSDGLGNPLNLALTGGQVHDVTQAPGLLLGKQADRVIADKGYEADALIEQFEQQGVEAVVPPHANRKQPCDYDWHSYKERHLIECLFSKIKQYHRVFSRFGKLARNYWGFPCFACALIWLH